jgi:serine/threonine protein kinase
MSIDIPLSEKGKQTNDVWTLDDFEIKNSDSNVKISTEKLSNVKCAIKFVPIEDKELPALIIINRFKNEILLQKDLQHPNIIKLHGYFFDDNNFYIVYELGDFDMFDVFVKLQKIVPYSDIKIINYFKQLASAIIHLHNKGIMHRDLKLDNLIYFVKEDRICIADFEYAIKAEESIVMLGTEDWFSPEIRNRQKYNNKIDIYGLGLIIYSFMEGALPSFKNGKLLFYKSKNNILRNVVTLMLMQNPGERISSKELEKIMERL